MISVRIKDRDMGDAKGEDGAGEDQETPHDEERVQENDDAAQDILETDAERQERLSHSLSFLEEIFSRERALQPIKDEVDAMLADEAKSREEIAQANTKSDEYTSEITMLHETHAAAEKSLEEVQNRKKAVHATIEGTKRKIVMLQEKDKQNKAKIRELYAITDEVKANLEKGSGWTEEQLKQKEELEEKLESAKRTLESKTNLIEGLRSDIQRLQIEVDKRQAEVDQARQKYSEVAAQTDAKREEASHEQQKKVELETDLHQLQAEMKAQTTIQLERKARSKAEAETIANTEQQLRDSKKEMEKYLKEYEKLYQETRKCTEQLETLTSHNDQVEAENEAKRRETTAREKQLLAQVAENAELEKEKLALEKKLEGLDKARQDNESQRDDIKSRINQLTNHDIPAARRESDSLKRTLEDLKREQEILSRKHTSSEKTAQLIVDMTKVNQNTKKNLENELSGTMGTVKFQRQQIETLVQDKERHENEAKSASRRHYSLLEQLKMEEVQIAEMQRKILESTARLKQQQNLYEAVRADRNLYNKNLVQAQSEIAEMKQRFKIMNHQIDLLKEEITAKDHALVKEHFNHHNVDKECDALKNEVTKVRKQIVSSEQIIANQRNEIQKLSQIIQEAEEERQRQKKECTAVLGERNILQSQLVKRNEELSKVYEHIKLNWARLRHGEARFAESVTETQFLKERIQELTKQRNESAAEMGSMQEVKYTIHSLDRAILREKTKIKALQEELERPLNVHRWRVLESSDPPRFDMIKKIHRLQKQLIQKNEELSENENKIEEQEKLYIDLKRTLARLPGTETAEQLALFQSSLKAKNAQLNRINEELEMYRQKVSETKEKIEESVAEMDALRDSWVKKQLASDKVASNQKRKHVVDKV